jgi:drug/metabolite transporter (DMT)-like permease
VRIAALLLALTAAGAWGVGGILIKKGTDVASPATILAFQYGGGALLLVVWIVATRGLGDTLTAVERHWPLLLAILAVQFAAYLAFIVAVKHAGAGSLSTSAVIAIAASYPAVAAILSSPMLGESLHWNDALGVALVVSGVIVTQAF